jgi:hypothetical protein
MFASLESLPIYVLYLILVLILLISFEIGFRISRYLHLKKGFVEPKTLGLTPALLGLLAFVLAFTFSLAASQYKKRKEMVLVEANAISTAYLRADLVDELYGREIKQLLREYVDTRLISIDQEQRVASLKRSVELHRLLWQKVRLVSKANPSTNTALLIEAINEVIDTHEKRKTAGLHERIPDSIWLTLISMSIIAIFTIGLEAGFGNHRRLIIIIPLVLAFTALITLIVELNNPQKGMVRVGQESMISLQKAINTDA